MIPDELLENILGKQICMHLSSKKDKSNHERPYCLFKRRFINGKVPCKCFDYEIEVIRKC